jgi:hypothetical protein
MADVTSPQHNNNTDSEIHYFLGKIGINITPSKSLELSSSITNDGIVFTSPNPSLFLVDSTNANKSFRIYLQGADDGLAINSINDNLSTGENTRLFIEHSTGRIGIGTTDPDTYRLAVVGGATLIENVSASIKFCTETTTSNIEMGGGSCYIDMKDPGTDDYDVRLQRAGNEWFRIQTPSYTNAFSLYSGNIGLGITNPTHNLHILSTTDATILLQADSNPGGSEGNNASIKFMQDDEAVVAGIGFGGDAGSGPFDSITGSVANSFLIQSNHSNSAIQLATQNIARLTVTSGGDVGIGTTAPTEKFEVNGDVGVTASGLFNTSNGDYDFKASANSAVSVNANTVQDLAFALFVNAGTGRVGIGTSLPSTSFDVDGNANVTGTFTATSKSFIIDHPSKPNAKLQHGCLEGPEHAVYYQRYNMF